MFVVWRAMLPSVLDAFVASYVLDDAVAAGRNRLLRVVSSCTDCRGGRRGLYFGSRSRV